MAGEVEGGAGAGAGACNLTSIIRKGLFMEQPSECIVQPAALLVRNSTRSRPGIAFSLISSVSSASFALYYASAALCALIALLLLARRLLDRGCPFPLSKTLYAKRFVSPSGALARSLHHELRSVCANSIGEMLPHSYLHDPEDLSNDKVILVVYDKANNHRPAMFHVAFRARYAHAVVVHLGLVMVRPEYRRRGLQRVALLNMALCCLTFMTARYVVSDIADSPTNSKLLCDHLDDVFPHYRHSPMHSRPLRWQLEVATFLLRMHHCDFGTSSRAQLDERSLTVYNSNDPTGGGSYVLSSHSDTRRSRESRANAFVESLLGQPPTSNEVMHIGVASLWGLLRLTLIRSSSFIRKMWAAVLCSRFCAALVPFAALGRGDRCLDAFAAFCRRARMRVQAIGAQDTTSNSGGVVLVSNHYTWLDFPVIATSCSRLPRPVVRADMGKEGMFGAIAQFVVTRLGALPLLRSDKHSSRKARKGIHEALQNGDSVLIFPEGTSQRSGLPQEFKVGGIKSAFETNCRVQPLAVSYSEPIGMNPPDDALERTSYVLPHQTQALVKFCEPLNPEDFGSALELAEKARECVAEALSHLHPLEHMQTKKELSRR